MAGITADANILINHARLSAQRYLLSYQEPITMEQLVQQLCDLKQGYTQYGGVCIIQIQQHDAFNPTSRHPFSPLPSPFASNTFLLL